MIQNLNVIKDSFETRITHLGNRRLVISVENTLPIFITLESYLQNVTIKEATVNLSKSADNTLTDNDFLAEAGTERFTFMGGIKSPLTHNIVYMYYDGKYKDILLMPNLEFFKLTLDKNTYEVRVSRLGSGNDLPNKSFNQDLPTERTTSYELPEPKGILQPKCKLISLPGTSVNTDSQRDESFEELINDVYNLQHNARRLQCLVELGDANTVFKNAGNIPLFLLYQHSIQSAGIKYMSNMSPGNNKLYFRLKF